MTVHCDQLSRLQALLENSDCCVCDSPPKLSCTNGVWRIECMDCMSVDAEHITLSGVCDEWKRINA